MALPVKKRGSCRQWVILVSVWLFGLYVGSWWTAQFYSPTNNSGLAETLAASRQFLGKQQDVPERLAASQRQVQELQSQLEQLERQKSATTATTTPSSSTSSSSDSVCSSIFGSSSTMIPSALSLWNQHLPQIHAASQLVENDVKYDFYDFTAQLLQLVTPKLPQSILSVPAAPSQWQAVERILTKAVARYNYTMNIEQGPVPEPIKMVILGGSVLVGRNCRKLVKDLGLQMRMPQRHCTFSHRLEKFAQEFWATLVKNNGRDASRRQPVLQVTKIAMGGTNTATGSRILEYDLVPLEARNPDIILNAYSTNDMHVLTMLEAQSTNQTLRQKLMDMVQDFVRTVLQRRPCGHLPPLVLHLDDYLGNEQREITSTMELQQTVTTLAQYYGIASLSYANVVRQTVYGDTREHWFSPQGWWTRASNSKSDKSMQREIHPNMGMHISANWVVAYNLLNLATTYCSMEAFQLESRNLPYNQTAMALQIPLRNYLTKVPGKPRTMPAGLPPVLTPELSLENVTQLWIASTAREDDLLAQVDCNDGSYSHTKCIFSWVSGLSLQQNNITWIEDLFGAHRTEPTNWSLQDDGGKLGLVPSAMGDSTLLEFTDLKQPIGEITFFTMRSYGPKWDGSRLKVETFGRTESGSPWKNLAVDKNFDGFHAKNTSELYTEEIAFADPVPVGGSVRLRYTLVGGTTFKIMGLAVCT